MEKKKLSLKKEIVAVLADNNVRGGYLTVDKEQTKDKNNFCGVGTVSACECLSLACPPVESLVGCVGPQPPVTGGCPSCGCITYGCQTKNCISEVDKCAITGPCLIEL